jgi:hypothetical protein
MGRVMTYLMAYPMTYAIGHPMAYPLRGVRMGFAWGVDDRNRSRTRTRTPRNPV